MVGSKITGEPFRPPGVIATPIRSAGEEARRKRHRRPIVESPAPRELFLVRVDQISKAIEQPESLIRPRRALSLKCLMRDANRLIYLCDTSQWDRAVSVASGGIDIG
jgi:hypothetical protein